MTYNDAPQAGVPSAEQADFRTYLRVLRQRKGTIFVVLVLVVGGALGFSFLQRKQYTATAEVLLQSSGAPSQFSSSATTALQPSDIQTQVQLITSAPVKAAVAQQLGRKTPDVSVSPVGQTDVIDVAATSTAPREAAAVANAYANSYVDFRRTQEVNSLLAAAQQVQAKVSDLDRQMATLNAQVANAPSFQRPTIQQNLSPQLNALSDQEAALKTQLGQLQLNSAVQTGAAQVVTPASVPTSPSSPRILRNGLIAAAAGLILGIGLAFLREHIDDRVKTKEDLERAGAGLPVLGLVPVVASWRDRSKPRVISLTDPKSPAAEAYRAMRTSTQFLGLDRQVRTLQVTSPTAAEGKTTIVANLAVTLAWAGQRVIVVCCDLRRPRIHTFFGLSNETGFTSVLLGNCSLDEACQQVPGQDRLAVLASGPLPVNPSEVFISRQAGEVLRAAQQEADVVLLDCPPVLPVTDAAVLSAHADATLVVVSAFETTKKVVGRTLEVLGQVSAPVVGTVLNNVATADAYGYAYKYRYYAAGSQPLPLSVDPSTVLTNGERHSEYAGEK